MFFAQSIKKRVSQVYSFPLPEHPMFKNTMSSLLWYRNSMALLSDRLFMHLSLTEKERRQRIRGRSS